MLFRAAAVASIMVRHVDAYTVLIADDAARASRTLARKTTAGIILLLAVGFVIALACGCVVAVTWDTAFRLAGLGALMVPFIAISICAFVALRGDSEAPEAFARTRLEWHKDRELLEQLLDTNPKRTG